SNDDARDRESKNRFFIKVFLKVIFLLQKYSKMIIDLQLIGFYHKLIGFQKKKKKKILGYFNLFIFEVLIFVTIKSSFEFYKQYLIRTEF
ncbi:hypothetical protein, partial [Helicobacter pylori]|uniref:hypothetical protein n=1 Tax=Helicobacter pylori TaxID=210 RepID=UPI000CCEB88C